MDVYITEATQTPAIHFLYVDPDTSRCRNGFLVACSLSIDNHSEIPENDDCDDFVSSAKRVKSSKQIYVYESEDDDELVILD